MQHPKRSQYKYTKKPYRIGNWATYEAALRSRGDLTIWLSEEAVHGWRAAGRRKPGGKKLYTNLDPITHDLRGPQKA